jgi:16S rRNA (guanine527-N7)-methyltransferase
MPTSIERFSLALDTNASDFGIQLTGEDIRRLSDYYELLLKWNDRLHLFAPCAPEEFATRHVLESLMLLRHLPAGARVVDVGTGAGLPTIPCLIVREDLRATLIESSKQKAAFLREALRIVQTRESACVFVSRFEHTTAPQAEFVTSRALDRFQEILSTLTTWAPPQSTLLLFAGDALRKRVEELLPSVKAELIPQSERRFLLIARRN